MAGGSGTRLWPESRKNSPKQTKPFIDDKTLLQKTFLRLRNKFDATNIWVTTSEAQKELIYSQLPDLPKDQYSLEPAKCDTAAAIGLATVKIHALDQSSSMININSDAYIAKEDEFINCINIIEKSLENNPEYLIGLGITPNFPETGYGYIKMGKPLESIDRRQIFNVEKFVEKPDKETAEKYLEDGSYLWNPTLFCWKTETMLNLFKEHAKDIYDGLMEIHKYIGSDKEKDAIKEIYPSLRKTSIDYAIFENTTKMAVLEADFGWSDVGSWSAVKDIQKTDNALKGNVKLIDSNNCLVYGNKDKFIAGINIKNLIVVDTDDALLICDKNSSQDVKKIVEYLKKEGKDNLL